MVKALCPSCQGIRKKQRNCPMCDGRGYINYKNRYQDIDPIEDKVKTDD